MNIKDIKEVFTRFQKDRHNEDKGRNFNLLQEIYSKTELFDITRIKSLEKYKISNTIQECLILQGDFLKDVSLPFECMLIHVDDRQYAIQSTLVSSSTYIFIREFDPIHITGAIVEMSNEYRRNLPFTVNTLTGVVIVNDKDYKKCLGNSIFSYYSKEELFSLVANTLKLLNSLNTKTVIADVPTNPKATYYRRKGNSAIKVPNKNIYYVINKGDTNSEKHIVFTGTKEVSHAFRVRGHWRILENSENFGKDRHGNRCIKGYTWVTEYVKGDESDILRKVHIVK